MGLEVSEWVRKVGKKEPPSGAVKRPLAWSAILTPLTSNTVGHLGQVTDSFWDAKEDGFYRENFPNSQSCPEMKWAAFLGSELPTVGIWLGLRGHQAQQIGIRSFGNRWITALNEGAQTPSVLKGVGGSCIWASGWGEIKGVGDMAKEAWPLLGFSWFLPCGVMSSVKPEIWILK